MPGPLLPNLPGYSVSSPTADAAHNKRQTLRYVRGYANEEPTMVSDDVPEGATTTQLHLGASYTPSSVTGSQTAYRPPGGRGQTWGGVGSSYQVPKWVANNNKVLRWFGYFKEAVDESALENWRVRRVTLLFYLEDDTCQVTEPKEDNSGLPQGVHIRRHRIETPDGRFYEPRDFAVGGNVAMYGRTFHITDADAFTRGFLQDQGLEVGPAEEVPCDPYEERKSTLKRHESGSPTHTAPGSPPRETFSSPNRPANKEALKQFMRNSRKVLRFYCIWDDRLAMYGDRHPYRLHYFLEDDTVEILEVHEGNSGRDPFPVFLRRAPLPKDFTRTKPAKNLPRELCYGPQDFRIGTYVQVYGRDFLVHDCDDFTRHWYQETLGLPLDKLEVVPVAEAIKPLPVPALPPYNGYGSLEDSEQSCKNLVPKPPKKDFYKLMNKDKIILRFGCRFVETATHKLSPADRDRRFVLSYFMADDTLSIFEPPLRNSGIIGGKYLERSKVFKNANEMYSEQDLYVGKVLPVHHRTFELLEADEFTYQYMENNRHVYLMADWEAAIRAVRAQISDEEALRTAFINVDKEGKGDITESQFEEALRQAGVELVRHQGVSLYRRLAGHAGTAAVRVEHFLQVLHSA